VTRRDARSSDVDCHEARRLVAGIRNKRRSQNPEDLLAAARALGFEVDAKRGKGSHLWLVHPEGVRFPVPTGRRPVRVGTTTAILRRLEEVLHDVC
jgi:predicted RNA binding protein YcfA (HicA-like mRNA interferase family)